MLGERLTKIHLGQPFQYQYVSGGSDLKKYFRFLDHEWDNVHETVTVPQRITLGCDPIQSV
jgi:hypothetical protein